MKSCLNCSRAKWDRTASGRLHPSGNGRCMYVYKAPPLPQSMYWLGRDAPTPYGGHIKRNEELKDHCAYFLPVGDK